MNRKDVLDVLKQDLKKIQSSRGYSSEVDRVERGIYSPDEANTLGLPFVCFYNHAFNRSHEDDDSLDGYLSRTLEVEVYGFAKVEKGNLTALDDLTEDLEKFFYSETDNTYFVDTEVTDIKLYEQEPTGAVIMSVNIRTTYNPVGL